MALPPEPLRCKGCQGVGVRNNDDCDDCLRCNRTGIDFEAIPKWIADPSNDPKSIKIDGWDPKNRERREVTLAEVIEKWIFLGQPPLKWATVITANFSFDTENIEDEE